MQAILAFLDAYRGVTLIATVIIIMAIEWAGREGILLLMGKAFGSEIAERYDSRWTAIGVVHHELSHLLVAFITGARIDDFRLYQFKREEGDKALGYVNYTPRGIIILPLIQRTFIGIAPALLGSLNVCLLGWYIMQVWQNGGAAACLCEPGVWVAAILMAQIAYHSCPSAQDIKGAWISILIFALLVASSSFQFFTLDVSLWIIRTVLIAMAVSSAPVVAISTLFIAVNGVKYLQHTCAAGRY